MRSEDEYTRLRQRQKQKEEDDKKQNQTQPKCTRCGKLGHFVKQCLAPKKPTDKE